MIKVGDHPSGATAAGGRYRIEGSLGQGGMAVVQRVLDTASGRSLALKRLRSTASNRAQLVNLFEREYLTLAQLAHPRIVEAYDYGVDDEGPYYTMELLDGGDLQGMAPLPWQRVCMLARDVCSALSLLHSRRTVYRDLSPRNVRCTTDGSAKLIDFGAMMPMGVSRELVGTLPFVAPEALHQQPLDARTDLYALGATLYFTLTQRHAYPARDVAQLRDFWRSRPRRPSELVAGLPDSLDALIMDLIHLDPAVRPASAAEVMERLGAIAGIRTSEQQLVSQAYLSNPSLVGRDTQLSALRKQTLRALHRRGVSVLIQGAPGLGRTRFLDACVLEAKLAGMLVLRADSADAQGSAYDVVRALAHQLLSAVRPLALDAAEPHIALLAGVIPELLADRSDVTVEAIADPEQLHRRVQPALRHWLLEIARRHPLVIAIDELARSDNASIAFVSLLAQEISECGVLIAATASREHGEGYLRGALELFASASTTLELEPLTLEMTEQLLGSVFGEVPNVPVVAHHIHRLTAGNPRDIMRIAQHLVSEDVIRYRGGSWSLPSGLDASVLPASMADALRARVDKLSGGARTLAQALAFEPGQRFAFDECALLLPDATQVRLLQMLDELVEADVLLYAGQRYILGQQGWAAPLALTALPEQTRMLQLRVSEIYQRRGEGFRAAQYLLKAGEHERGLDLLLHEAARSEQDTDGSPHKFFELLRSLPPDWLSTYELGLSCCRELNRPAKHTDILLSRLAGLVAHAISQTDGYLHVQTRLDALHRACGLDLFAAQPSSLDFATRLKSSLEAAHARFLQTPEAERLFDPGSAMRQLAKTTIAALGTITFTIDYEAWQRLPSLAPLAPLSPALALVHQLTQGLGARITAHSEHAIATYGAILERLAQPDRGGLEPAHHLTTVQRLQLGIGTLEAAMGRASSLERAQLVEREPLYETQALLIRHIYHVWQGDSREASRVKREIELRQVESNSHHGFEGQHLVSELCAYALSDDLTRVKRATDAIEPRARVHRAWLPVFHYGRGEYHRIRGDHEAALQELECALSGARPAEHQIWPSAVGAQLRALLELGCFEQVLTLATEALQIAEARGLGFVRNYLRMPLSLTLSKLGRQTEAVALAQSVIDELLALGATGLNLAAAYETRARIDLEVDDRESFERHAALCAEQWRSGEKRLIGAKYERTTETRDDHETALDEFSIVSQFTSTLESCQSASQRARCGLEYLGRQSGAIGGLLYTYTANGLVRSASFGEVEADQALDDWAAQYFGKELEEEEGTAAFSNIPPAEVPSEHRLPGDRRYVPVLLNHQTEHGFALTGVAMLMTTVGGSFSYPSRVAAELSRCVASAGDVVTAYA